MDPQETTENTSHDTNPNTSDADTATTTSETRWELGFFARKVTTTSTTPPEYEDPPGG